MAFFIRVVTSSLTCLKTIERKANLKLSSKQEDRKSGIWNFAPPHFIIGKGRREQALERRKRRLAAGEERREL